MTPFLSGNELIIATNNAGKLAEFSALLAPWHCIAQSTLNIPSIEETGQSFIENAILKARHASRLGNKPALGDDSGLVVNALRGKPGIYSARFAHQHASDKDNITYLLSLLTDVSFTQRGAFFYCALACVRHPDDPMPLLATGTLQGIITSTPIGNHGFGYDPIFYLEDYGCTVAALPLNIKNTISHRAQALKQLRKKLNHVD